MRDFRREELFAAVMGRSLPAPEFSWSVSRHVLFHSCRFAYFLNYGLAQGGWDPYAESSVKFLYLEKHAVPFRRWIASLLNESLGSALEETRKIKGGSKSAVFRRYFRGIAFSRLSSGLASFMEGRYLESPKSVHFCDRTSEDHELLLDEGESLIGTCERYFAETDTFKILLGCFDETRVSASMEKETFCGETRIYAENGVNWIEPGAFCSLRFVCEEPEEKIPELAADVFAYSVRQHWKREDSLAIFLFPDREKDLHGDAERAVRYIESDREQMLALERRGMIRAEDFPRCGREEICASCRFRTGCAMLFEEEALS